MSAIVRPKAFPKVANLNRKIADECDEGVSPVSPVSPVSHVFPSPHLSVSVVKSPDFLPQITRMAQMVKTSRSRALIACRGPAPFPPFAPVEPVLQEVTEQRRSRASSFRQSPGPPRSSTSSGTAKNLPIVRLAGLAFAFGGGRWRHDWFFRPRDRAAE